MPILTADQVREVSDFALRIVLMRPRVGTITIVHHRQAGKSGSCTRGSVEDGRRNFLLWVPWMGEAPSPTLVVILSAPGDVDRYLRDTQPAPQDQRTMYCLLHELGHIWFARFWSPACLAQWYADWFAFRVLDRFGLRATPKDIWTHNVSIAQDLARSLTLGMRHVPVQLEPYRRFVHPINYVDFHFGSGEQRVRFDMTMPKRQRYCALPPTSVEAKWIGQFAQQWSG